MEDNFLIDKEEFDKLMKNFINNFNSLNNGLYMTSAIDSIIEVGNINPISLSELEEMMYKGEHNELEKNYK